MQSFPVLGAMQVQEQLVCPCSLCTLAAKDRFLVLLFLGILCMVTASVLDRREAHHAPFPGSVAPSTQLGEVSTLACTATLAAVGRCM